MHTRIKIYWCRSSIFRHLKLELLTQFPASNDEKYINVVYIWRKFVSFYGYVHWRMTTEISVMYGSEKVKMRANYDRDKNKPKYGKEYTILCINTIFCINHGDKRLFFQIEIIINVLISSSQFIWISMLWVHGHHNCFNFFSAGSSTYIRFWARILVQVTIYRRLLIGRDDHLDQSEAYDIS